MLVLCLSIGNIAVAKISIFKKPTTFSEEQQEQIKQIVHDYLIENPDILINMSKSLQKKILTKMKAEMTLLTKQNAEEIFRSPHSPVIGNPKGDITLVEFFDYKCRHCGQMVPVINKLVKENPGLRVVFKDFAIFGDNSILAAKASLAANAQGKYLAFHEALLKSKRPVDKKIILDTAEDLNLNMKKFNDDINKKEFADIVQNSIDLAKELKLRGTPAFFVAKTNTTSQSKDPIVFISGQTTEENIQKAIDDLK